MKKKILIVIAEYYSNIASGLEVAAKITLDRDCVESIKYKVIKVPGVFEIPVVISKNIKKFDGCVALGCVIKGETPHFDYISKTSIDAIMKLSIENKKPIGNGILTCLNISQAAARSEEGVKKNNKGKEAARAVLSVLGILKHESR